MKKLYVKKRKIVNNKKENLIKFLKKLYFSPKSLLIPTPSDIKFYIEGCKQINYIKIKTDTPNLKEFIKNKLEKFSLSEKNNLIVGFIDKKRTLLDMNEIANFLKKTYNVDEVIYYAKKTNNINKIIIIIV